MDRSLRIMLVDDESIVGKRLKPALEKSGYEVEVFEDGRSAVDRVAESTFDIVVTDIRMEEFDGMQVLEQVQKVSPQTKIIIITGYATVELAREALIKGAFDFIAKPFRPDDLRTVIEKAGRQIRKDEAGAGR